MQQWLATFLFPPIPISLFPFPRCLRFISHSRPFTNIHSHSLLFPFPSDSWTTFITEVSNDDKCSKCKYSTVLASKSQLSISYCYLPLTKFYWTAFASSRLMGILTHMKVAIPSVTCALYHSHFLAYFCSHSRGIPMVIPREWESRSGAHLCCVPANLPYL